MKLQMLDTIVSYKKPTGIIARIADRAIIKYQEKLYPKGNNRFNHVRVFIGEYSSVGHENKLPLIFEWTTPVSRVVPLRPWMVDPNYSWVMRHNALKISEDNSYDSRRVSRIERWEKDYPEWRSSPSGRIYPTPLLDYSLERSGKLYDYLQLLGIGLGVRFIQVGPEHEVCSTGGREFIEDVTGLRLFEGLDSWRTPPSSFVNDKEWNRVA